jgi:hypothetical protein
LQDCFDLRKEAQKSWEHHVCNKIVYFPQSLTVFANRQCVRMQRVSLPEIYFKADGWIELQFCLVGERNAHYVAIIESLNAKIKRIALRDRAITGLKAENVSPRDVWKPNYDFTSIRRNSPMLVEVTEGIQPPEGMGFVGLPSTIRLKRFDFLDRFGGNSGDLPIPSPNVLRFGGQGIKDGKLDSFRRRTGTRQSSQTPNDLIETGAHVIESVSDRQTGVIRNIEKLTFKTIPLLFKIVISPQSISLRSGELFQKRIQRVQMHLRPTKFQIGIGQSWLPRNGSHEALVETNDLGYSADPLRHPESILRDVKG